MIDLGLMLYFLGIEGKQIDDGIFISQKKYDLDILKRFKMESSSVIHILIVERLEMKKKSIR